MNLETLTQALDTPADWTVNLFASDGSPLPYDGTESVSAKLWAGDSRAATALATTWNTEDSDFETAWAVDVSIPVSAIESLQPATYRLRVYVGAEKRHAAEAFLKLLPAPGTQTEPPSYCSPDDLRNLYSEVERLQTTEDQAGLAEARGKAREWFDDFVLKAWTYAKKLKCPTADMETKLTANRLVVSPQIRRINANYSLGCFLKSKIGVGSDQKSAFQQLGDQFRAEAFAEACHAFVKIDISEAKDGSAFDNIKLTRF